MIKGDRISFRKVFREDLDILLEWENNPEHWEFSETSNLYSKETMRQFVNSKHDLFLNNQLRLMILHDDQLVGCIDLFDFEPFHLRAGVGILIDAEYRRKGYAKASLLLLLEYVFKNLKINQLHCKINSNNKISLSLFESCGFKKTGTFKSWMLSNNQWDDLIFLQCISKTL